MESKHKFDDELSCDVVVKLSSGKLYLHKSLLAAKSPLLKATIARIDKEKLADFIDYSQHQLSANMKDALRVLYTGTTDGTERQDLGKAWAAAVALDLDEPSRKIIAGKIIAELEAETGRALAVKEGNKMVKLIEFMENKKQRAAEHKAHKPFTNAELHSIFAAIYVHTGKPYAGELVYALDVTVATKSGDEAFLSGCVYLPESSWSKIIEAREKNPPPLLSFLVRKFGPGHALVSATLPTMTEVHGADLIAVARHASDSKLASLIRIVQQYVEANFAIVDADILGALPAEIVQPSMVRLLQRISPLLPLLELKKDLSKSNLYGKSFSGLNMSDMKFIESSLEKSRFSTSLVDKCDFTKANMTGCRMTDTGVTRCDFTLTDLTDSNWGNSKISDCQFATIDADGKASLANLKNANFSDCVFEGVNFTENLQESTLPHLLCKYCDELLSGKSAGDQCKKREHSLSTNKHDHSKACYECGEAKGKSGWKSAKCLHYAVSKKK